MKAVLFSVVSLLMISAHADSMNGTFSAAQVKCGGRSISVKENPWYSSYTYDLQFFANGDVEEVRGYLTMMSSCRALSKGRYTVENGILRINEKVVKASGALLDCPGKNEQAWKLSSLGDGKIELRGDREQFGDHTFKCSEKEIALVFERKTTP